MKREQKQERERNLKMLTYLNKKEKQRNFSIFLLLKQYLVIKTQQRQERKNKNIMLKMRENRSAQNQRARKKDLTFVNNFNQAKNIIEKQMFKGMMIKEKRKITSQNRLKKEIVKQSRVFLHHQAIPNKVFDTSVSHPMMFNSVMNSDKASQNTSVYNEEKEYETNGRTSTVYGQSFLEFPQYPRQERTFDGRGKSQKSMRTKRNFPKKMPRMSKRMSYKDYTLE